MLNRWGGACLRWLELHLNIVLLRHCILPWLTIFVIFFSGLVSLYTPMLSQLCVKVLNQRTSRSSGWLFEE